MSDTEVQFLDIGERAHERRIAYRHSGEARSGCGVLWLIGLKSDMDSTKATALAEWTGTQGLGYTRFDYSGHGRSSGRFEVATTGDWIEEAKAVFTRVTEGPQIVVGSSTGAHVALRLLRELMREDGETSKRILGLVLIAPAWDVTELMWRELPDTARREVMERGQWMRPSPYDAGGYPITRQFIEEGRRHLIANDRFDPGRPVLVLQGLLDDAVPPEHARALSDALDGNWVRITEIPDGDHRLSRPQDLMMLTAAICELCEGC